jgi:hypothetical protein
MSAQLQDDAAWACAVSIMECLQGLFREEEKQDGFGEIYRRIRAAIECYEQMRTRELQRLRPSRN